MGKDESEENGEREGKRKRKEEWGKTKLRRMASWWEGKRKRKKNNEREKRKQYCSYQEHLFGSGACPGRLVPPP
jgi:hypothetical protein